MSKRVFVVDDEKLIAETLAAILQKAGFDATFFTNPLQALGRAIEDPPDLLITDVLMPQLSGVDLAVQIKERCPNCKILLFSGQAATADLLQAPSARGHNFTLLAKPVHPTDLLREIGSLDEAVAS